MVDIATQNERPPSGRGQEQRNGHISGRGLIRNQVTSLDTISRDTFLSTDTVLDQDGQVGEDSPLLGKQVTKRERKIQLSVEETEKLFQYLDEASDFIYYHLQDEAFKEQQRVVSPEPETLCSRCTSMFAKFLEKFTGARGIAATIILQLLCLVMLTLVDALPQNTDDKKMALEFGSISMLTLQTLNLIIVIFISLELFHQIQRRMVSRMLLIQSYIATVLLFAGIYTATYRLYPKSWKFVEDPDVDEDPVQIVTLYTRLLFFSVSTATLCGAADALPKEWYTCIFVSVQMLLSFMYFTSVLGTTLRKRKIPEIKRKSVSPEVQRELNDFHSSLRQQ